MRFFITTTGNTFYILLVHKKSGLDMWHNSMILSKVGMGRAQNMELPWAKVREISCKPFP